MSTFTTSALQGLCTLEQLDLLNSIDTLRSQGISHYVSLPQIIVCGDQSSGKSSVLEAISGVSFPVKSSLCTRFPTELVLRKNAQVGVRVSIVPHQSRCEAEQLSLSSFCETLDGFEGLATLVENAKAAMGISTHGKAFSNDLLRVEISGPDRPHLTIVDLPGLIHSPTRQQSSSDVELVQEIVQSYMQQPRSIILAVVSAKNDFANQIVLNLARSADPSGRRTLGVITKPDTLIPGSESESMFLGLAKNEDVQFRLGWHVLKNMDSEKGRTNMIDRDNDEREFFSTGAWASMSSSLVGIDSLRGRLSKLLLGQIATELPSLINEIQAKMDESQSRLQKLGIPRITLDEQRSYLVQISQALLSLLKAGIDGTYGESFFEDTQHESAYEKRVRAVVQNLNEDFASRITRRGHHYQIGEKALHRGQVKITRNEYIEHIEQLLKKSRGRELPGMFNPMVVRQLFLEYSRPWDGIAHAHVTRVWEAAKSFLELAVNHVADEATSSALFDEVVEPALDDIRGSLIIKTRELLRPHLAGHPITYNHYFTENVQNLSANHQEDKMRRTIEDFFHVADVDEPYCSGSQINLRKLLTALSQPPQPNMTRFASEEALDRMLAYYQVALKRFIDDMAIEVIETKLMLPLYEILSPIGIMKMSAKLVARIAGESEENCAIREQVNKKLAILQKGSETCKKFVGIRSLDSAAFSYPRSTALAPSDGYESSEELVQSFSDCESLTEVTRECSPSRTTGDGHVEENLAVNPAKSSKKTKKKKRP